jgi:hypothetical protein
MPKSITQALNDAIDASGLGPAVLEQKTGVDRGSIARFLAGETSLRLDKADRLAASLNLVLMKGDEMSTSTLIAPNVFVYSAASAVAQQHYQRTMEHGVSLAQVCEYVVNPDTIDALGDAYPDALTYCWGGRSGGQDEHYFDLMKPGDLILCYREKRIAAFSYFVAKVKSARLGRFCWTDEQAMAKPYDLVYFVSRPTDVDKPIAELSKYFGQIYLGLRRVAGTDAILRDFGSLESFVEEALLR